MKIRPQIENCRVILMQIETEIDFEDGNTHQNLNKRD